MSDKPFSLRPIGANLVVRPDQQVEQTPGGLFIPTTAKGTPSAGVVVACGSGRVDSSGNTVPLEVKAGDHVLFVEGSGTEIEIDGQKYRLLTESFVLGVLD